MYKAINKNAKILNKIKKDASPKIPRHYDTHNPSKTTAITSNGEVLG